jgi:hypothetical protein
MGDDEMMVMMMMMVMVSMMTMMTSTPSFVHHRLNYPTSFLGRRERQASATFHDLNHENYQHHHPTHHLQAWNTSDGVTPFMTISVALRKRGSAFLEATVK